MGPATFASGDAQLCRTLGADFGATAGRLNEAHGLINDVPENVPENVPEKVPSSFSVLYP